MPCIIQILHVHLIADPAGQKLRVMGRVLGCPGGVVEIGTGGITATTTTTLQNESFAVTMSVVGNPLACEDEVTVTVTCLSDTDPSCTRTETVKARCCEVAVHYVAGVVPSGSLTPTHLEVAGELFGCFGDQVVISSALTGQSTPITANALTGRFSAQLQITATGVQCGHQVTVTAWCASNPDCNGRKDATVACDCLRAQPSFAFPSTACVGSPQKRETVLSAVIGVPAGWVGDVQWDYGDGSSGPAHHINNSAGSAGSTFTITDPGHFYAPGTYTAQLRMLGSECPPVTMTITVTCPSGCPTGSITETPGGCTSGKRQMSLEATVTAPANSPAFGQWDYGYTPSGGSSLGPSFFVPAGATQDGSSNPALKTTWNYPQGTHTVCLKLNQSAHPGCNDICKSITVQGCPPPGCDVTLTYTPDPVPCIPPNGSVTVNFVATHADASYNDYYTWEITTGGGTVFKTTKLPTAADPNKLSYTFTTPGTYEVVVTVATPGCDDPVDSSPPAVLTIKGCCPSLGPLQAQELSMCEWAFIAQADNPNNAPLTFEWTFQDGTTKTTTTPSTTHKYQTGAITTGQTTVVMKSPGCPDVTRSATVTHRCFCPTIGIPTANVSGCAPTNAAVSLSTSVSPSTAASSFGWSVTTPSGTVFTKTTSAPTTTDGTGDGVWTNTSSGSTGALDLSQPGAYSVSVTAAGPGVDASCQQPAAKGFSVSGCNGDGPPAGCGILRILLVLLIAGLAVTIMGFFCFGWPIWIPIAVAVALMIALVVWIIVCRPSWCDVLLTLWQAAFTAMWVLLYLSQCLSMAGCIGWAWWIAAVIFVGLMVWWLLACKPTTCTILVAFIFAIADALAIMGMIALFATFATACLLPAIPAVLGAVSLMLLTAAGPILGCSFAPR